jgi:hypothetical protein
VQDAPRSGNNQRRRGLDSLIANDSLGRDLEARVLKLEVLEREETPMKTIGICLAVCLIGSANAEPLTLTTTRVDNGWQKVRRHCDQYSRCWDESWRNPLLESYATARPPLPVAHAQARAKTWPKAFAKSNALAKSGASAKPRALAKSGALAKR